MPGDSGKNLIGPGALLESLFKGILTATCYPNWSFGAESSSFREADLSGEMSRIAVWGSDSAGPPVRVPDVVPIWI